MVEDRITDGKRIAQLLSSELSGRDRGTLGDVSVVDADPDAEPSPEGTEAYGIGYRSERIGTVRLFPEAVTISVTRQVEPITESAQENGLAVTDDEALRLESGASVKRAVDAVVAGLVDSD